MDKFPQVGSLAGEAGEIKVQKRKIKANPTKNRITPWATGQAVNYRLILDKLDVA